MHLNVPGTNFCLLCSSAGHPQKYSRSHGYFRQTLQTIEMDAEHCQQCPVVYLSLFELDGGIYTNNALLDVS